MTTLHTLAFEIGTEEIPAFDLHKATLQLATLVPAALSEVRIPHGEVTIYTTPRRLVMMVKDVASTTETLQEVFRGPAARIAFDEEGNPTKAATGFARGKGLGVETLERREENGVEYVFATRVIPARDVAELLPEVLQGIITKISWPKSCRWGATSEYFSRPVRWLLALLDERIIPVTFAGLEAANMTCGHRFLSPGPHCVSTAANLLEVLETAFVITSEQAREEVIRRGVAQIEKDCGAQAQLPEKTLLEVINLCEYPTPLVGTFDQEFLEVPEEIIVDAMLMHQRYFPLYDEAGKLTNNFIVVSNGNPACATTIINGNERVVRARLSDAKFFYEEDLKHPLADYVERLDEVVFQERLGTMRAKTDRVVALVEHLAHDAQLGAQDSVDAARAAYLAKADLVTNAVVEFTSVQGIMGAYYAQASGENEQVAQVVSEHYRPRFSGDEPPALPVGKIVAMADKLDTVCGLFAVGQGPTGSSDPFALRRNALGIIAMLEGGLPVSLGAAIDSALSTYKAAGIDFNYDAVRTEIVEFFITRTKVMLRDGGCTPDAVDAVLASGAEEPAQIISRTRALETARLNEPETFDNLAIAYARANNLREEDAGTEVREALVGEAERMLLEAINATSSRVDETLQQDDFEAALEALSALRDPIDTFFTEVMIMDEDLDVRKNRLALLNKFVAVFAHVADFGKIAKAAK